MKEPMAILHVKSKNTLLNHNTIPLLLQPSSQVSFKTSPSLLSTSSGLNPVPPSPTEVEDVLDSPPPQHNAPIKQELDEFHGLPSVSVTYSFYFPWIFLLQGVVLGKTKYVDFFFPSPLFVCLFLR